MSHQQPNHRGQNIPSLDDMYAFAYGRSLEQDAQNNQAPAPPPPPPPAFASSYDNVPNLMLDSDDQNNPQNNAQQGYLKYPQLPQQQVNPYLQQGVNNNQNYVVPANQNNQVNPYLQGNQVQNPYLASGQVIPMNFAQQNYQPQLNLHSQQNLISQPPINGFQIICEHKVVDKQENNNSTTFVYYLDLFLRAIVFFLYLAIVFLCYLAILCSQIKKRPYIQATYCRSCGVLISEVEMNGAYAPDLGVMAIYVILFCLFFVIWHYTGINICVLNFRLIQFTIETIEILLSSSFSSSPS